MKRTFTFTGINFVPAEVTVHSYRTAMVAEGIRMPRQNFQWLESEIQWAGMMDNHVVAVVSVGGVAAFAVQFSDFHCKVGAANSVAIENW